MQDAFTMLRLITLIHFFCAVSSAIIAQNQPGASLRIKKAKEAIKLDGILDEPDWLAADVAKDWYLNYPVDTARSPFQTEARLTFDDHHLYISFIAFDDQSDDMIHSLRRDFNYDLNDNVGISFSPYNDRLNGFFFTITPAGVQMDGTVANGGSSNESFSIYWDNRWFSKVVRYPDRWICELAIPFNSIRYKSGIGEWNIAFDRLDKKRNMKSSWIRTPIQYITGSFAYSGQLVWEDPIPPAHTNISFIPFVAGGKSWNTEGENGTTETLQAGFDGKVGITPSLNLDLTVNPDFSQVEVDQQVINLSRFEVLLPERRQFFLENSDLNDQAGFPDSRLFFSRRIGIARDTAGFYHRIPIAYGARISGSITRKWRTNIQFLRTKETMALGLPAQNYAVATLQRNFWSQSSVAFTYVDKLNVGVKERDSLLYFHESVFRRRSTGSKTFLKRSQYNRAMGLDLELLSKDNKWYNSAYISRSFDNFSGNSNASAGAYFQYSVRNWVAGAGSYAVGENFNAETGFVPSRNVYPGLYNVFASLTYKHYPKNSRLVFMGPAVELNQNYIPGGLLVDKSYVFNYTFNFLNTAVATVGYNYNFQHLTNSFNPVNDGIYKKFLPGEEFAWHTGSASFQSNTRSLFNFKMETNYGGFYNGTNLNVNGELNYRYQPYGNISMRFDFNNVRLAEGYGNEKLFLVGPRIDITFTDKIFLTTYIQYNNLIDNVNLNARFQWRYKPASDFYIVYTENYFPDGLASKNKALVFKLNYWLNF
jgi:hypothetical protein